MSLNCAFTDANARFRYRAAAIIVEKGQILFAANDTDDYYYSVGGAVHHGETAEEAVVREVYEETGLRYEIDRLAVIHECFFTEVVPPQSRNCHEICLYFLMKPRGTTELPAWESVCLSGREHVHFLPIEQLEKVKAFPMFMKEYLENRPETVVHIVTNERK